MCQVKLFAFLLLATGFSYAKLQCGPVNKTEPGIEKICGYENTASFDYDHHFSSASRAVKSLKHVLGNCSDSVDTMICSLFLPRCTEDIRGPYLPCRAVCHDYATECLDVIRRNGLEWTVAMCDILPERDNPRAGDYRERCFTPPNFKDSGKKYSHNCSDVIVPACQDIPGYTKTVASLAIQRTYSDYIARQIKFNKSDSCSQLRKEIVCAENLPACVDGAAGFLCRDNCERFFNTCNSPFFYDKDMCIEFPRRGKTSKDKVICKQTHWPRAENWQLSDNKPVTMPTSKTGPTETMTTRSSQETPVKTDKGNLGTEKPPAGKTDALPPGVHARKSQKGKSGSSKLTIGLVVSFILLLVIAIGILAFVWYRRKLRSRDFDYQKQVLYSEDKAEEFEIFT